jgi:hypothetical protein
MQPISLLAADKIVHVNLDRLPAPAASGGPGVRSQGPGVGTDAEDELVADEELPEVLSAGAATALSRLLVTAQAELEALAENGLAARRNLELLGSIGRRSEALGLAACARPLARVQEACLAAAQSGDPAQRHAAAGAVLHAYYVLRLAGQQEAVAAATAGLA